MRNCGKTHCKWWAVMLPLLHMRKKKKVMARNIGLIRLYKKYRGEGKSYGQIIKLIGKDKKQFQRWNSYIKRGVLELSTGK